MAKGSEQLAELVGPILAPGEVLIGTARVNYNGMIHPNTISLDTSINAIEPFDQLPPPDPEALVSFPTANQMAMALTDGRLFVWSLGFSGKPKQFIGEVPLTAIVEATSESASGRILRIVMKSRAVIDLEFLRGEPAEEFSSQLSSLVGSTG